MVNPNRLLPYVSAVLSLAVFIGLVTACSTQELLEQAIVTDTPSPTLEVDTPKSTSPATDTPIPTGIPTPEPSATTPTVTPTATPTPTATNTPTPTARPARGPDRVENAVEIYDAARMEGWPDWCNIVESEAGRPLIHIPATDYSGVCFPHAFTQVLGDFEVVWTVKIDGRSALLQVGQERNVYWIDLRPREGLMFMQQVQVDAYHPLGPAYFPGSINRDAGLPNTVTFIRIGSKVSFRVNGELVLEMDDVLFNGQPTPVQVGFGLAGDETAETTVELVELRIRAPQD